MLIREKGLVSLYRLRVLTNMNAHDICNVMRKAGSKNTDEASDGGQQVSVIAEETLKPPLIRN